MKTRANVIYVCIFYNFFCFRFNVVFLLFLKFQISKIGMTLSLITQTELFVCLIRIIYDFIRQIRVAKYNLEAMPLINPVYYVTIRE